MVAQNVACRHEALRVGGHGRQQLPGRRPAPAVAVFGHIVTDYADDGHGRARHLRQGPQDRERLPLPSPGSALSARIGPANGIQNRSAASWQLLVVHVVLFESLNDALTRTVRPQLTPKVMSPAISSPLRARWTIWGGPPAAAGPARTGTGRRTVRRRRGRILSRRGRRKTRVSLRGRWIARLSLSGRRIARLSRRGRRITRLSRRGRRIARWRRRLRLREYRIDGDAAHARQHHPDGPHAGSIAHVHNFRANTAVQSNVLVATAAE